jgi:3-deoxy-7-phosphoheptulonate synthase
VSSEVFSDTAAPQLASREKHPAPTEITFDNGVVIGGDRVVLIAGPCAVEDERQLLSTATGVADAGAQLLRGGAFKPRTSPYAFQGLGVAGLELLARARRDTGLLVVTEAMDQDTLDQVASVADVIQVGLAEHGELRAAQAGRADRETGAPQARNGRDARRAVVRGGIHPVGRERAGDPV